MKIMKLSSLLLLAAFFMCAFIPEASARHCKKRTSFGLSFNVGGPSYAVAAPAPVYAYPTYVAPAPAYVAPAPAYAYPPYPYYAAPAPVMVERPAPRAYVQPGFSYSHYRY